MNRDSISKIVDGIYPSSYRVFTVNSWDRYTLAKKPIGLFVSLGITTSIATIRKVLNEIARSYPNTFMSELESRFINGMYVNYVSRIDDNIDQYSSMGSECWRSMNENDLNDKIKELKNKIVESGDDVDLVMNYSSKISAISKVLNKFLNGTYNWNDFTVNIIDTDTEFRVASLNKKINFIQESEERDGKPITVYKRIGIFVRY